MPEETITERIDRLHQPGLVDMHFDMLMDLYEKRKRTNVLNTDYWPDLQAGDIGLLAVNIFLLDIYLPEMGLRVALNQVARLYTELDHSHHFTLCRNYADILQARQAGQIALLLAMEGVEPLGGDLDLLRLFYELGLRELSLTHSRRNQAGEGGIFAPAGSSPAGLTAFGRAVVQQSEALGIILDLAHLNPAGFEEVMAMTTKPVIVSHTNPRHYYDIERNTSDAQLKTVGERGGVIGVGALLLSPHPEDIHLDMFVDHITYIAELIGVEGVGLGFDFFEAIFEALPERVKADFEANFPEVYYIDGLANHAGTRNLTRKLIERGFSDEEIAQILYGNFMRVFESVLSA